MFKISQIVDLGRCPACRDRLMDELTGDQGAHLAAQYSVTIAETGSKTPSQRDDEKSAFLRPWWNFWGAKSRI